MKNADKFKAVFGLHATELWSMSEEDFLKWLNSESTETEPEWKSTKEMQPPKPNGAKYYNLDGEDIAADEYNVMIKGATEPTSLFWSGNVWFSPYGIDEGCTYNVTHWKPLPEPYRGEQNENT